MTRACSFCRRDRDVAEVRFDGRDCWWVCSACWAEMRKKSNLQRDDRPFGPCCLDGMSEQELQRTSIGCNCPYRNGCSWSDHSSRSVSVGRSTGYSWSGSGKSIGTYVTRSVTHSGAFLDPHSEMMKKTLRYLTESYDGFTDGEGI